MNLEDYTQYDAMGLAQLVQQKQVSARELADLAAQAITKVNPHINAVIETYSDRIEDLDENSLHDGPFKGVPYLIKDVTGHLKGRKIEFGSRLCEA